MKVEVNISDEMTESDERKLQRAKNIMNASCVNLWEIARETAIDSHLTVDEIEELLEILLIGGVASCLEDDDD